MVLFYDSKSFYFLVLFMILVSCHNINNMFVTKLRELSTNFTHSVLFEDDKLFLESVVLPNYACNTLCPIAVFRPISSAEVSQAVLIGQSLKLDISVRGGGHGYTCQAVKDNSIMLDMRQMKQIQLNINNISLSSSPTITLETGLTWFDVINYLEKDHIMVSIKTKTNKSYITVHGQCTSVGVAGFSLHGGVHFGGLSELYGLSSDNIRGLTAVLANSSIIELTSDLCIIDGSVISESSARLSCQSLFYAFRGSGSSFGIVTSLTLQLYEKPILHTALSIVSVKLNNSEKAQAFLSHYLNTIPENVSVTLFGLNAYFKAYLFVLKFSHNKNKWQAINNDMMSLFPSKVNFNQNKFDLSSPNEIHFIVEASWLSSNNAQTGATNKSTEKKDDGDNDTYQQLIQMHKSLSYISDNGMNTTDKVAVVRDWIKSTQMWSVPSYDLVWGEGHSYGGATIIVDGVYEAQAIQASMKKYFTHLTNYTLFDSILGGATASTGDCDDCVAVLHRVGSGLRRIRHDSNSECYNNKSQDGTNSDALTSTRLSSSISSSSSSSSFNPFRHNASLWIEIDCGHFHRHRSTWESHCSPFIDATQQALDESVPDLHHKAHYPNVPSLNTQNWQMQYYGEEGYKRLQAVKQEWDPHNVFSHAQSIRNNNDSNSVGANHTNKNLDWDMTTATIASSSSSLCTNLYDKKANQQFYRILLVVGVTILCIILRGTMTAVSRRKKFNRFQWLFTSSSSKTSSSLNTSDNKKSKKPQ